MGNSITQYQKENQEQYRRTLSRGMHYRSHECEDEEDKLGIEKNEGNF